MAVVIRGGDGSGFQASVTSDFRLEVESVISGTPTVVISGGIHIGSVSANVDSIYIQSGANMIGSVGVTNLPDVVQSSTLRQITAGSVKLISTDGSIATYTDGNVGSVVISGTSIPVSRGVGSIVISGTSIPVSRGIGSVLSLFTDSDNVLDSPLVADGSYLMIAGSISSMPDLSTTNESVAKPGTAGLGSMTIIAGFSGGVAMPLRTIGSDLAVSVSTALPAGDNNIGNVDIVTQPSWTGVGSVVISGTSIPVSRGVGSVVVSGTVPVTISTDPVPVSGNALGVSGTAFQQVWVGAGSVVVSGTATVNITTGSVRLLSTTGSVSIYYDNNARGEVDSNIQIGNLDASDSNPVPISGNALGVSGTAFEKVWVGTGSVVISGTSVPVSRGVGSVVISGTSIPVSRGIGSVLALFTDSSNTLDSPLVADGSYLMMAGSISSIPSITTTSESVYKGSGTWDGGGVGSLTLVGGNFTGSVYPLHLETGSNLLTVGSTHIINFGEIGSAETQGVSGTAFNTVWLGVGSMVISGTSVPVSRGVGSVVISGTSQPVSRGVGSVLGLFTDSSNNLDSPLVADGSYLMIAGSISSMPSITATNESVAKPGTVGLAGSVTMIAGISGGVAMPLRTTNGSDLVVNIPDRVAGSIVNLPVGSNFTLSSPGSVSIFYDNNARGEVDSNIQVANSDVNATTNNVPTSGLVRQPAHDELNTNANIQIGNTDASNSNPVPVSGNKIGIDAGSVILLSNAGSIGVFAGANTVFGVSGTVVGVSGIVNQGTTPWVTTDPVVEQDYSGVTFITTGSKLIWSPATGSKAQLKAFSISSDVPQHLTIYFSGTAAPAQRQIWSNRMPASGMAAMNLFGITCSGPVDAALGAVVNVAGSVDITVFCRSLK